jgi:hypothetical protein
VNDQDVEGIAIFRAGRRDEAPVVRIGEAHHQRLPEHEDLQFRVEVQLHAAAARRLDHRMDVSRVGPGRKFRIVGHFAIRVLPRLADLIFLTAALLSKASASGATAGAFSGSPSTEKCEP